MTAFAPMGRALLPAVALLLAASTSRADYTFDVRLDTSPLRAISGSGPFAIDFALINGRTAGNNSVTISNIAFGAGGGAMGSPSAVGGASGSLGGGVSLKDSALFNDFSQAFTPGGMLSFRVAMTTNVDVPTPDQFSFSILDGSGLPLPTTDPDGSDALLSVAFTGLSPTVLTYRSDPGRPFPGPGSSFALAAPTVTPAGQASVPEPGSLWLVGSGLIAALFARSGLAAVQPPGPPPA